MQDQSLFLNKLKERYNFPGLKKTTIWFIFLLWIAKLGLLGTCFGFIFALLGTLKYFIDGSKLGKWRESDRQAYLIVAEGSFWAQYRFCVIIFKGIKLRLMVKIPLSQHATLASLIFHSSGLNIHHVFRVLIWMCVHCLEEHTVSSK